MKPVVSKHFNLEDIRKVREYNSLCHIQMTTQEIIEDIRKGAEMVLERLEQSGNVDLPGIYQTKVTVKINSEQLSFEK